MSSLMSETSSACARPYRQPQEDVYVYRVTGSPENLRRVFLDYLKSINELHNRAEFYNTLTTNCTTSILLHTRISPGIAADVVENFAERLYTGLPL